VAQGIAWTVIAAIAVNRFHIAGCIDHPLVAILTLVLIVNVSSNPKSIITLDYRALEYLGKISYGLYVIHPLVIFFFGKLCGPVIDQMALPLRAYPNSH
jgi:peptidoglycan/LPS O-acetylase OafA/YrhL